MEAAEAKPGKGLPWTTSGIFGQDVAAFGAAGRQAASSPAAPAVPSCPGWVVTDLVLHLGLVHRMLARVISERMQLPSTGGMPRTR